MMQFIERLRELSGGKPTGFKLCIGHPWEWFGIAKAMHETGILPDFIVVDGAEGGTGAAPLEFCDHVGAPLQEGLLLVHNTLVGLDLRDRIKIGCAGKVVSAFDIARMLALGADWCNAARGFMFALGCIQAQTCHTGACPTGVTTQDPQRQKALDVAEQGRPRLSLPPEHAARAEGAGAGGGPSTIRPGSPPTTSCGATPSTASSCSPTCCRSSSRASCSRDELTLQVFRIYWPMASAASFSAVPPTATAAAGAPGSGGAAARCRAHRRGVTGQARGGAVSMKLLRALSLSARRARFG